MSSNPVRKAILGYHCSTSALVSTRTFGAPQLDERTVLSTCVRVVEETIIYEDYSTSRQFSCNDAHEADHS